MLRPPFTRRTKRNIQTLARIIKEIGPCHNFNSFTDWENAVYDHPLYDADTHDYFVFHDDRQNWIKHESHKTWKKYNPIFARKLFPNFYFINTEEAKAFEERLELQKINDIYKHIHKNPSRVLNLL